MFKQQSLTNAILKNKICHMKTLKQLVTYLRNRDYSQERIARIAGVSQMTISRWAKENPALLNMNAHRKLTKEVESLK